MTNLKNIVATAGLAGLAALAAVGCDNRLKGVQIYHSPNNGYTQVVDYNPRESWKDSGIDFIVYEDVNGNGTLDDIEVHFLGSYNPKHKGEMPHTRSIETTQFVPRNSKYGYPDFGIPKESPIGREWQARYDSLKEIATPKSNIHY